MTLKMSLRTLRELRRASTRYAEQARSGDLKINEIEAFAQMAVIASERAMRQILDDVPDAREPIEDADLNEYGWEPGDYLIRCRKCERSCYEDDRLIMSSKRSIHCRDCAMDLARED